MSELEIKQEYYNESLRYMSNAADILKNAGIEGRNYKDEKYVSTACSVAYFGVLKALDAYLMLKQGDNFRKPESIDQYKALIAKYDKKMLKTLSNVYGILHINAYYLGITNIAVIKESFADAKIIINHIKSKAEA